MHELYALFCRTLVARIRRGTGANFLFIRLGDRILPQSGDTLLQEGNGMEEKISSRKNALDVAETVVSLLCLVGVVVYLILAWGNIPDRIPGHYNALGEVDHWSSKSSLIVLPIISWMLFGFITLVERYPQIWNTGITVTEENRDAVYRLLKSMIALVKMFVLLMFASLTVLSSFAVNLPIWYILGFLVAVFGTIAVCIVRLNRIRQG